MYEGHRIYSNWILEKSSTSEILRLRIGINTIGRMSASNIRITESDYVSRQHAQIEVSDDDNKVFIKDLKSMNGVYVNGVVYKNKLTELSGGDRITIGVDVENSINDNELYVEDPIYRLKHLSIPSTRCRFKDVNTSSNFIVNSKDKCEEVNSGNKINNANAQQLKSDLPSNKIEHSKLGGPNSIEVITLSDDDDQNEKSLVVNFKKDKNTKSHLFVDDELPAPKYDSDNKNDPLKSCNANSKKESEMHVPMLPTIKEEYVRSVSEDIRNIFGETDEVILEQVKDLNVYVYKNLKSDLQMGNSYSNVKDIEMINGDCICLSSDDEDLPFSIGNILYAPTTEIDISENNMETNDIFILPKTLKNYKEPDLENMKKCHGTTDQVYDNVLFSQEIINDVKTDLEYYDISQNLNNLGNDMLAKETNYISSKKSKTEDFSMVLNKVKCDFGIDQFKSIKREDFQNEQSIVSPLDIISDDELDEEFESQVCIWADKLFSQKTNLDHTNIENINFKINANRSCSAIENHIDVRQNQKNFEEKEMFKNFSTIDQNKLVATSIPNKAVIEELLNGTHQEQVEQTNFTFLEDNQKEFNIHNFTNAKTGQLKCKKIFPISKKTKIQHTSNPILINALELNKRKCKTKNSPVSITKYKNVKCMSGLKSKWLGKSILMRKHDKELLKKSRKERLKEIANKQQTNKEQSGSFNSIEKRKLECVLSPNENSAKRPKVKVTEINRGAFLANESEKKNYDKNKKSELESPEVQVQHSASNNHNTSLIEKTSTSVFGNERFSKSSKLNIDVQEFSNNCTELNSIFKRKKKKKSVTFNLEPTVYYIEPRKKIDNRNINSYSTYSERRFIARNTYPFHDFTNKVLTMILKWSNNWLITCNAEIDAATEMIYPMPYQFNSFQHYKSIIFPLMKLEFICQLEREYKEKKLHENFFKVNLDYVTVSTDRLTLITKLQLVDTKLTDNFKCDLVLLKFGGSLSNTFAYETSYRKSGLCLTIVYEIPNDKFYKNSLTSIQQITVFPIINNMRVDISAFNAIFQLESTPLFKILFDPLKILDYKTPPIKNIHYNGCDKLNENQLSVLLNTYVRSVDESTPKITLIQGPPGTGKSFIIKNLALQLLYGHEVRCLDKKILICAQSNGAVDVIAEKLLNVSKKMNPTRMFRVIRYGVLDKISHGVMSISLQKIVEKDQLRKFLATNVNIESKDHLKLQISQLEAEIQKMEVTNLKDTVLESELNTKQKQLKLMKNVLYQNISHDEERRIYAWHLNNANIICTTLSSCVKLSQFVDYFDVCIVDEATQCSEPWTLFPLKFRINSLVLVGDTQQLPATVLSKKASDYGLRNSLFKRIQSCFESAAFNPEMNNALNCLTEQYRMHPEICKWPNSYFYKNELINAACTQHYTCDLLPFSIMNLAYTQDDLCTNGQIQNNLEAEFVVELVKTLDTLIPTKYNTYGIITPYAVHKKILSNKIRSIGLMNIMVNTIDSYQGLEKDVIIISNARTDGIGFLSNYQRLNVALTRSRKCLVLCGNFRNFESVPAWSSLLKNARERNLFFNVDKISASHIRESVLNKIRRSVR